MQFTENSLEASHEISRVVHQIDNIAYALQSLGIPAGEELLMIRDNISSLAHECAEHIMKEQPERLLDTQNQTWNLVGAVLENTVK